MANRDKLIKKAEELGVEFNGGTTNSELQELINEAQNSEEKQNPAAQEFDSDFQFFRSTIAGLSVPLLANDPDDRGELLQEVAFTPVELFNEDIGEHYRIGLLATDEQDVIEVLLEDPNVTEITLDEYNDLVTKSKPVA